jgi:hypothetical protein
MAPDSNTAGPQSAHVMPPAGPALAVQAAPPDRPQHDREDDHAADCPRDLPERDPQAKPYHRDGHKESGEDELLPVAHW